MNKVKHIVNNKLRALSILLLILPSFAFSKPIITTYRDGVNTIKLNSLPNSINYKLILKGKSKYKYILAVLEKETKAKQKQILFKTNRYDKFSKKIIILWGRGNYTLKLYGSAYENSRNYKGLLKINFFAKGKLPKNLVNTADIQYYAGKADFKLYNISKTTNYLLKLQGYNDIFPWLQINVYKNNTKLFRKTTLVLKTKSKFSVNYLIKDGKGKYKIKIFGSRVLNPRNLTGLAEFSIISTKNIPANLKNLSLNSKILEFVNSHLGQKVGTGECWDLAQQALDIYSADWKRPVSFGILLNPDKDKIIPGDIIQFYKVILQSSNKIISIGEPDHTAIIYKVNGKYKFQLAQQNVNYIKKVIVDKSFLNIKNIRKGKYWIYRPVKALLQGN